MLYEVKDLLEDIEEHAEYDKYLDEHIGNVQKGYQWLLDNLPELVQEDNSVTESAYYGNLDDIIAHHDQSKRNRIPDCDNYYELTCEYDAYADYFYGTQTPEVKDAFDRAWLAHIHANPHHWQHWMLQNDTDGLKLLDMPYVFIIEMICDWWSFSWKNNNLHEIFEWYDSHKDHILISEMTRKQVENILAKIKTRLVEAVYD